MPRKIFPLKLSDTERQALDSQAAAAGLDPTNYLRLLIEKDAPRPSGTKSESRPHCSFDPSQRQGGMFHCPDCGEMVLAGVPHPDYSRMEKAKPLIAPEDEAAAGAGFDFGPG